MGLPNKLYKTTVVIWSEFDLSELEIDVLAREAVDGVLYCSSRRDQVINDPDEFPDTEFFNVDDDYYVEDND